MRRTTLQEPVRRRDSDILGFVAEARTERRRLSARMRVVIMRHSARRRSESCAPHLDNMRSDSHIQYGKHNNRVSEVTTTTLTSRQVQGRQR
ncbi:hypothetical protein C8Q73DRAFT_180873 [Cubamyces lactineus]|nr:hypothetical protein C8Q73DRAFT_180873 [Cubamyces lactineus]